MAKPDFTPTTTPIYATSSFSYEDTGALDAVFGNEREGYVYSRYGNPTTRALEVAVAELEGTEDAIAFASGMAAVHAAILSQVQAGSRVVAARDVYGATYAILTNVFATLGVKPVFVDILDLAVVEAALKESNSRVLTFETISNPLLRVADIAALSELAHAWGATVVVDNSFASPYLVSPAQFGADLVVHSTTKYLGGHGDTTGGVIAASAPLVHELREQNKLIGSILSPFEAWLTLRGIKTLPLRMRQQSENAAEVAAWLASRADIDRVYYPGTTEQGRVSLQFNNSHRGGMISFEIAGAGRDDVFRFLQSLRLCVPATTLGDVYSLVLYPAISSHRALTPEQRAEIGIGENLVRLSVGIEDVADIIADLDSALDAIRAAVGVAAASRFEEE
ncbi:MAG: aminotransferase class I/II-fold pyridoxal phosphate-dependent enzyme [Chloroflexota bacterium]|nr:aminotransferase class I/II-fold pyridoxal phosphate-dependent enzyme [Chloroflexota bacterium]